MMDFKEMREKLREVVETVPRSNDDMVALYKEKFPEDQTEVQPTVKAIKSENVYTYIGAGHEPPSVIKFMGLQAFSRGKSVTVTNPVVLEKIKNHPCFIKGEVEPEVLIERDEEAKKQVEERRKEDEKIQLLASKNKS